MEILKLFSFYFSNYNNKASFTVISRILILLCVCGCLGSSETRVTDHCKLPCGGWEYQWQPFERAMPLNPEPSLQPIMIFLLWPRNLVSCSQVGAANSSLHVVLWIELLTVIFVLFCIFLRPCHTIQARLALRSQRPTCLYFPSARIKGMVTISTLYMSFWSVIMTRECC